MLVFIIFLLVHFIADPPRSYPAWHDWMLGTGVTIGASVFAVALLMHAWVGVRDVIIDYVKPIAVRVLALSLLALYLTGLAAWLARILWLRHG